MAEGSSREHSVVEHLHSSLWSQTMNIVGQLAETVFVTMKELYRGINPATLTGGIDVIVVRQPDGSFQCSPFHVRFGKLGVLRSKEKVVDIEINGECVDLHMKLGDNGEAFFVEENENMEDKVPAYLCTSPIPFEIIDDLEETAESASIPGGGTRKKKRRRKRVRSDAHMRDDTASSSDERERERENDQAGQETPTKEALVTSLHDCKSVYYSFSDEPNWPVVEMEAKDTHPYSDEHSPKESPVFNSRPNSPKSDSELLVKHQDSTEPQMQWNWGGFPMPCQSSRVSVELEDIAHFGTSHFCTIQRQESFDMGCEPVITCGKVRSVKVVRPQPRTRSLDLSSYSVQTAHFSSEIIPHVAHSMSFDLSVCCPASGSTNVESRQALQSILEQETTNFNSNEATVTNTIDSLWKNGGTEPENVQPMTENTVKSEAAVERDTLVLSHVRFKTASSSTGTEFSKSRENQQQLGALSELSEQSSTSLYPSTCAEAGEEDGGPDVVNGSIAGSPTEPPKTKGEVQDARTSSCVTERLGSASEATYKTDHPEKKKGKRNHHLGPTGIYLDDLTKLDPEVAALYFPKSDTEGASYRGAEQGSGSQSPQSVGSAAMDSGTEYLSDSATYSMDVSMSLCRREGDASQITKENFMEHIVTYQDFVNNPGIIEDPSLVICINSNYYNWAVAAPMVLSMAAFQKNLPTSAVEKLVKDKMPKKSGRWWFSWRRRDMKNQKHSSQEKEKSLEHAASTLKNTLDDINSDEVAEHGQQSIAESNLSAEAFNAAQCISQMYRKSLRLTSEQIEHLNLREGANKVVFSVTTQYQGTCRCEAAIYLWNWDDRIIISDIDGTITKSDALGHILPQFGKDWTHQGIAKLYHRIHQNGYKFLYCSARAIGMAGITKNYLQWVNDRGTVLPKGPVLLAPSSLFSALHREVIEKKPEVFKVACLNDIKDLFNAQRQPFYAAFGNRTNDAYAYKQVGVPDAKIFSVNPKGELIQEMTKGNKSTYSHLSEAVEHFFPFICVEPSTSSALDCPDYSYFSYWKEPLPELDLDTLL
ncbi:phosphatidate phosphatase LPIN2-like isoform X2 [Thalassophryne amazonica]|uniref:phosphatidate phosphatase LPIN2-like isoform X2 n=1 Tax=Thalassophryne amazonica TaxID=390379 RepID=UPI00147159FB|nr:phosphatidate phosphatase LPIN2-like isoform X2 [Thalassophryne amazonica]